MKKSTLILVILGLAVMLMAAVGFASANTVVPDNYWGGTVVNAGPTDYGDQISGSLHEFGIDQAVISTNNGLLSVRFTGSYFASYLNNVGLAGSEPPGDLYISTSGWHTSTGVSPFPQDTFNASEGWNLVVSRLGGVYALDYSTLQYTTGPNGYVFRSDQAWRGGYGQLLANSSAAILDNSGVTFLLPLSVLNGANGIGLHYTFGCGNDIFEGQATTAVPIPPTALLLGSGLLGLVLLRRRPKPAKP